MKQILIIEDDPEIIKLLEIHLTDLIYTTSKALDGAAGLQMALEHDYDLILLDLTLPSMDGAEICKRLRKHKNTPVIMLTAKSEEIDRVLGLEIGAGKGSHEKNRRFEGSTGKFILNLGRRAADRY